MLTFLEYLEKHILFYRTPFFILTYAVKHTENNSEVIIYFGNRI